MPHGIGYVGFILYISVMGKITIKENKEEEFKYTESYMQFQLSHFFAPNSVKYDVDGLYIFNWESDKFIETRAGLIYEFEIKISKSDFKNDFKHKKDKHIILEGEEKYGDKYLPKYYDCLEENRKRNGEWGVQQFKKYADNDKYYMVGGHKRPNYFYYCTPPEMVTVDEVPWYAGLVWIDEHGTISIQKKAPRLHPDKIKDSELGLGEKFYYNMDKWRTTCRNAWKECKYLQEQLNDELHDNDRTMPYKMLETYYTIEKEKAERLEKEARCKREDALYSAYMERELLKEIRKLNPDFDYKGLLNRAGEFIDNIKKERSIKL